MSFPHLHVASAYSTHYGVTMPEALVDQAAARGSGRAPTSARPWNAGIVRMRGRAWPPGCG